MQKREFLMDVALQDAEGKKSVRRYWAAAHNAFEARQEARLMAEHDGYTVTDWRHMFVRDGSGEYREMF